MLRLVAFMLVPVIIYIKCGIYLLHMTKLAILRLCGDATALDFHGAKRGTFMIQSGIRGTSECNSDDWPLLDGWNRCSAIGRRDCRCRRHDAGECKTGICGPDRNCRAGNAIKTRRAVASSNPSAKNSRQTATRSRSSKLDSRCFENASAPIGGMPEHHEHWRGSG